MVMKLEKLDPSSFTYRRWTGGSIHDIIEGPCRYWHIVSPNSKQLLHKYAVGWCEGEKLYFKPKAGEVGILCFKNGNFLWFHLRRNEFEEVFGEKTKTSRAGKKSMKVLSIEELIEEKK